MAKTPVVMLFAALVLTSASCEQAPSAGPANPTGRAKRLRATAPTAWVDSSGTNLRFQRES